MERSSTGPFQPHSEIPGAPRPVGIHLEPGTSPALSSVACFLPFVSLYSSSLCLAPGDCSYHPPSSLPTICPLMVPGLEEVSAAASGEGGAAMHLHLVCLHLLGQPDREAVLTPSFSLRLCLNSHWARILEKHFSWQSSLLCLPASPMEPQPPRPSPPRHSLRYRPQRLPSLPCPEAL